MSNSEHGVDLVKITVDSLGFDTKYSSIYAGLIAALSLYFLGLIAVGKLRSSTNPLLPEAKLSIYAVFQYLTEFLLTLGDSVMGPENRKYLPFIGTLFAYVLLMNLLGLVPGFVAPTGEMQFNGGLAITVLIAYTFWGIKEVGLVAYIKHMCGPAFFPFVFSFSWRLIFDLFVLAFESVIHVFIFGVEIISHLFRPVSLSLRLFGNITADHALITVFTDMTKVGVPVIFYFLGIFVSFMQAFVFTMLTMIYIRLATAHEEEDHDHEKEANKH